jgi:hypothetical protein
MHISDRTSRLPFRVQLVRASAIAESATRLDSNDTMGRVLLPKVEGVLELAS